MTPQTPRHEITTREVLYRIPGMDEVRVRSEVQYRTADGAALTLDLYSPADAQPHERRPAVVFVVGFSDTGARARLGCAFKEMASFVSWARLAAASGLAAVTYSTGTDPEADALALLRYLRDHAAALGVDESRIGLWACSGHVPLALSLLMRERGDVPLCAALCYGYMLDLDGARDVADAAKSVRFVNPWEGKSVEDLAPDRALFIARAGQDQMPGLNASLDRFLAACVRRNLPVTFVNHPAGAHAFDLTDDGEVSRGVIRQVLEFLRRQLFRTERG